VPKIVQRGQSNVDVPTQPNCVDLWNSDERAPGETNNERIARCLQLLVIQPTSLCNLDCRYCYVPERKDASRLEFSTLRRLFEELVHSRLVSRQQEIDVLWHAGEPLTVGIDYYQQAIEIIDQVLERRWIARHSMQTQRYTPDSQLLCKAQV
jgi:sulfatase maturation enzyme AslB (radical SAM superfamily)